MATPTVTLARDRAAIGSPLKVSYKFAVEQNASMALSIAHRGYVLETGRIVLDGTAAALSENAEVRRAYLGE